MALRYFYQLDLNGKPVNGSNTALVKKPTITGAKRWVEFIPAAQSQPCCPNDNVKIVSIGKKWRYYVRISEATSIPINGTLMKHEQKPPTYFWQEVIGRYQCASAAQFNATFSTKGGTNMSLNIIDAMGLQVGTYTLTESGSHSTVNSHYTLSISTNGAITITGSGTADTIVLHYVSNGCQTAFQLTITP